MVLTTRHIQRVIIDHTITLFNEESVLGLTQRNAFTPLELQEELRLMALADLRLWL